MKKGFIKQWIAFMLAITLVLGENSVALAAGTGSNVSPTIVVQEVATETSEEMPEEAETPEATAIPKETEEPEETETPEEAEAPVATEEPTEVPEETPEVTPEASPKATETPTAEASATPTASPAETEVPTATASPEMTVTPEISETPMASVSPSPTAEASATPTVSPDGESLFPGLPEDYKLSSAEREDKKVLCGYADDVQGMTEGKDYVAGEVVVSAESKEAAQAYAEAFGGTLKEYFEGVAVISLNSNARGMKVSVADAVAASADKDSKLPAAWPNYYYYVDTVDAETVAEAVEETDATTDELIVDEEAVEESEEIAAYKDPYLKESSYYYQWHHNVVGSQQAWAYGYTGKNVKVAVLDTGINTGHQDVSAVTYNIGIGTEDGRGHGTHVAGIIGAKGDNSYGGSGVAPGVSLVSIKVLNDNGSGTASDIMAGVQKAIDAKVNIINMSLGGPFYSKPFADKVKAAYNNGIAVFCAAGNENTNSAHYPASYDGAISVAALDKNNHKASFSNYGSTVRYSAPGVSIFSTLNGSSSSYGSMSGTSQATPVTAGAAAVLWSSDKVSGNGKDKVNNLLALMDASCNGVTGSGLGKGCISLTKALGIDSGSGTPDAPVFSLKAGTYKSASVNVTITAKKGTTIYYTTDGKNITYKDGKVSDGATKCGNGSIITLSGSSAVTLKAIAVSNNKFASKVTTAKYTLKPVASGITITSQTGNNVVAQGKSLQLVATLTPSYTADKSVQWTVQGNPEGITVKSGKVSVKSTVKTGEYNIQATAKDANGKYVNGKSATFTIQVVATTNPITTLSVNPKSVTVANDKSANVEVTVKKKDKTIGVASDVTWKSADTSVATVSVSNGKLVVTGKKAGKTKITGAAKDGTGKTVTFNVTVTQPATSVKISGYTKLAAGKNITLTATVGPDNVTNKKVTWSISPNNKLVTVSSSGKVTAKSGASGTYTVKATAADGSGKYATYNVNVTAGKMTKLTLDKSSVNIFRKSNIKGSPTNTTIKVTVAGGNTDDWVAESSNPDLVTVTYSKPSKNVTCTATGNGTGVATITVKSTDGSNLKKTCKVTVTNPASNLSLAPEKGRSNFVAQGKKLKLTPVFETSYGSVSDSAKKLKWTSSNTSAVTVDQNGNVTAKKAGGFNSEYWAASTITVKTTDGSNLSATYRVIVCGQTTQLGLCNYSSKNNTILLGNSRYFSLTWKAKADLPSGEYDFKVDKDGLSVKYYEGYDDRGIYVVGNKPGTYKVTISCIDGSTAKKSYTFKVK